MATATVTLTKEEYIASKKDGLNRPIVVFSIATELTAVKVGGHPYQQAATLDRVIDAKYQTSLNPQGI